MLEDRALRRRGTTTRGDGDGDGAGAVERATGGATDGATRGATAGATRDDDAATRARGRRRAVLERDETAKRGAGAVSSGATVPLRRVRGVGDDRIRDRDDPGGDEGGGGDKGGGEQTPWQTA